MKAEVYWIEGPWAGRLAILPRPRGGDWLEDEIKSWKDAQLDVIVSVLTPEEESELDIGPEADLTKTAGLGFISYPIVDRSVPGSRKTFLNLLRQLERELARGRHVGVHCRQGIGRSALVAASLLIDSGLRAQESLERVSQARGCTVPETPEQREWVTRLSKNLASMQTEHD